MRDRRSSRLAIGIVERRQPLAIRENVAIEAARVDAVTMRMRTRNVERFHTAVFAEQVPRGAGVETVFGERVFALQQAEARSGHDEMQETRHAADRAVAFLHLRMRRRIHFETHAAAVAAAGMSD